MSDENTNHPSITELLTATYHEDTVSDLLELAKIQARTIERLTAPRPSLMMNIGEWLPMLVPLIHMLRPSASSSAVAPSLEFGVEEPAVIVPEHVPPVAQADAAASSAHVRHDLA